MGCAEMCLTTRRIQDLGSILIDSSGVCSFILPSLTNYGHIMLYSNSGSLSGKRGTETSHSSTCCGTDSKPSNVQVYSPLLWNAVQQKWPTHTPRGERERPEDFQKTFWGNLGHTYKNQTMYEWGSAQSWSRKKQQKERSKLPCTLWPHLESCLLMHQKILILQGTPKPTFLKNLPFFCCRASFHLSLSVRLQWEVRGDECAALHLFLFLRETFGVSEWWQ